MSHSCQNKPNNFCYICGDVTLYHKGSCYHHLWGELTNQVRDRHYHVKQWPLWGEAIVDQKNIAYRALVDKLKIYLAPLHIQLGLTKTSVKLMNKEGEGFDYLKQTFPCISEAKINNGIFIGPQVKQLFQDPNFKN